MPTDLCDEKRKKKKERWKRKRKIRRACDRRIRKNGVKRGVNLREKKRKKIK